MADENGGEAKKAEGANSKAFKEEKVEQGMYVVYRYVYIYLYIYTILCYGT